LDIKISLGGWSEFEGDDLSSPFLLHKFFHVNHNVNYQYRKNPVNSIIFF